MLLRATLAVSAALALTIGNVGCHACTEMGCQSGLRVQFSPALTAPGQYRLRGTLDGTSFECEFALPLNGNLPTCSSAQWQFDLHAGPATLYGVSLNATPASVNLDVERDGMSIGRAMLGVTYQTLHPNGEGCDPQCRYKEENLTVQP